MFGLQFEGTQAVMAEKAVDSGDRSDWSHVSAVRKQRAEKWGWTMKPGVPPIVTHSLQLGSTDYRLHSLLN